jgi:glycosyltransferase involved in cell wall biosynthesis
MKTILHTIDTTGPGGAETVFIDLATRLPRERYRSIVLIRGRGWVYDELVGRGLTPLLLDAKGSFNWQYLRRLAALIRREKIDLIQSHLLGSNVYCSLAGLLTLTPVVATFHGSVDIGERERLKALKFAAIRLGAQRLVAVSDSLRRIIAESTTLSSRKIVKIYNGISTSEFSRPRSKKLREQFGWSRNDVLVGCLGNVRFAKGYDVLLHAAARLRERSAGWRFVIAGQGKTGLLDDLLALRSRLKVEELVHFLGFQPDPAAFLSGLDFFLLPSTSEGFSIATIQAMAAGLPVIVTRSGGPEEIVTHGETGWLIDPGNPEAIVEALEKLAADKELCARLAANGRDHATRAFGIDAMLKAYQALYDALL